MYRETVFTVKSDPDALSLAHVGQAISALEEIEKTRQGEKERELTVKHEKRISPRELACLMETACAEQDLLVKIKPAPKRWRGLTYAYLPLSLLFLVGAFFFRDDSTWRLISYLLAYGTAGGRVFLRAFRSMKKGIVLEENSLMAIATVGALVLGEYVEAVTVMVLCGIGGILENLSMARSRKSIAELMDLGAEIAHVIKDGREVLLNPHEIHVGDIVVVRPGEKVPIDGIVIEGASHLDTSPLTGEFQPVSIMNGSFVLGGTINQEGLVKIESRKEYTDTALSRVMTMVEESTQRKGKTEHFIRRFARLYTPIVVFSGVLLALLPPLIFHTPYHVWLSRALLCLVASCPCALVISVPLSFFCGLGASSRQGILVKGANYLEILAHIDSLAFDKTGTLTCGQFSVEKVFPAKGIERETLLAWVASVEQFSNHPIAKATRHWGPRVEEITGYKEHPGRGIEATVDRKRVKVGSEAWLTALGIALPRIEERGTLLCIAVNERYAGLVVLSDKVKDEAKKGLQALREVGIHEFSLLTGDREEEGQRIAHTLGMERVFTHLLPDEKVTILERLQREGGKTPRRLGYVGDGINDAPVLARADVGIALGDWGTDAAIEAADVVLMEDKITNLAKGIRIARRTMLIVKQNVTTAIGAKAIVLFAGMMGFASLWAAILADVGITIITTMNSTRILSNRSLWREKKEKNQREELAP